MSTMAQITAEVLSFPIKSRALLADLLLDSLDDAEPHNYDEAWLAEAKRRSLEVCDESTCSSHYDVMNNARSALK